MNSKVIMRALVVIAVGVVGFMAIQTGSGNGSILSENNNIAITLYKSPTCGCCGAYASYMKKEGYDVQTENIQDMRTIKQELSVPYELESCHTMEIGEYVVEGHIPEEAIQKLLTERPNIKGIGMAGMPSGSPGMPGPKTKDFIIYEITHEGATGDVFMTI